MSVPLPYYIHKKKNEQYNVTFHQIYIFQLLKIISN